MIKVFRERPVRMLFVVIMVLGCGGCATVKHPVPLDMPGKTQVESMPVPAFAGGKKAITMTPVVGTPRREYADMFVPGKEALEDGEMRVTVLGSGNPWVTRAQASASILVEVGNAERDILIFDLGSGSLANYASLKLPVNKLNKVFLSHLHADHMSDLLTLVGSYAKVGVRTGRSRCGVPAGPNFA